MEKEKTSKEQEILDNIDRAINELVYDKTQLIKAYNYYHGKRDPEQFRHLEENYGIGTPTSVEFIPLVRKHVDVLIGEYLSTPLLPRVSCKDTETLSNIEYDKKLETNNKIVRELRNHLRNIIHTGQTGQSDNNNKELNSKLGEVQESTERNYLSSYEIAAQNIVD